METIGQGVVVLAAMLVIMWAVKKLKALRIKAWKSLAQSSWDLSR